MRDTTRPALLAVLAILAVAFAAATLDSAVTTGPGGPAGPAAGGDGGVGLAPPQASGPTPGEAAPFPLLTGILAVVLVVGVLALLVVVVDNWRETLRIVIPAAALFGLVFVLLQVLPSLTNLPPAPDFDLGTGGLAGGGGGSDATGPSPPLALVLLVLGVGLVGAIVAVVGRHADDAPDDQEADAPDAAAVGRAAGRAADRLEAADGVDNEVYRAWREMTELLDVAAPETSTPGEFADAAVDAGLGREDVDELTRLFEDVRYGDREPSSEREQRATTVFRRIEDRYAEDYA